jgi:dihydroflavonol-4-reductase
MLVVVTGASGHMGVNVCLDLLAEGHAVRAVDLRRPNTAVEHGARWFRGDVREPAAMLAAFDGADLAFHVAAFISVTGGHRGRVHSVNVDGVRTVARAAHAVGLPRLVHVSSVHAYDLEASRGQLVDEDSPRSIDLRLPAYDRSKAAGEAELARVVEAGLDAVTINPTGVIGPRDEVPSRMGSVLRAMWRGRLPALVGGGFDWVDVRDVVAAMRLAATHGKSGRNYLVNGHRLSVVQLARAAARYGRVTDRLAPSWTVRLAAPVGGAIARWTGSPVLPTREALHALAADPLVDGSRARIELGYRPRPFDETLHDLHRWFLTMGWVPGSR